MGEGKKVHINNFDQKVKEKYLGHTLLPASDLWAKIDRRISREKTDMSYWKIGSVAASVIFLQIALIITYHYWNSELRDQPQDELSIMNGSEVHFFFNPFVSLMSKNLTLGKKIKR